MNYLRLQADEGSVETFFGAKPAAEDFSSLRKRLRRNRDAGPQIFDLKSYRVPLFLFLRREPTDVFTKLGKVFSISGKRRVRPGRCARLLATGAPFLGSLKAA